MSRQKIQLIICALIVSTVYLFVYDTDKKTKRSYDENSNMTTVLDDVSSVVSESDSLFSLFYFPAETLRDRFRTTCYSLPNANDIAYNNIYWQVLELKKPSPVTRVFMFSAHYDDRPAFEDPVVHILAEITKKVVKNELRCLIWFNPDENAVLTAVESIIYLSSELKHKVSFRRVTSESVIFTCKLPYYMKDKLPYAVGLTNRSVCTTSNNNVLKIHHRRNEARRKFAVCMKGLQFLDDVSVKLVEWIEINLLLGAEFFSFYVYSAHANVKKVLNHYKELGFVEILQITLPGTLPNIQPIRQKFYEGVGDAWPHEYIPMNDCYMRNMKNTDNIAVLDIDELIVPLGVNTWSEMLASLPHRNASTFSFADLYFWDKKQDCHPDIPCYLHFMQRTVRARQHFESRNVSHHYKSMHDTKQVLTVTHHFERLCFENCRRYYVPKEQAQLQHYRKTCIQDWTEQECHKLFKKGSFVQESLWKYKSHLIPKIEQILEAIQLMPKQ